jgi:4-methylaminobutanoate oxidase (formaldehyde-forming)
MGMGYLVNREGIDDDWILSGRYEIDIEGKRIPAKAHLKAPYDQMGERMQM